MPWLTNLFSAFTLNPGLAAAGAGLIAAPIVIHLINRMRYRTVHFAAMEFLLASQQKNRRRVLLEQLLLLLLRVLIVAGLVLLIARLVLDPGTLSLLRAGAQTQHIILLDDSGSMRNRLGEKTAFENAKDIVRQFTSEVARSNSNQQLTVMLFSQAKSNEAIVSQREINEALRNELDTRLRNTQATRQDLSIQAALEAARERLLADPSGPRVLHVISDFRHGDWLEQPGHIEELIDLGESGVSVNLVRVVGEETGNLGVTSVSGDLDAVAAGIPVRVQVGVTNWGREVVENVGLGVRQDGKTLPLAQRFARIEPGTEVVANFEIAFPTPGRHALRFELESDSLPADDHRFVAVDVAPSLPVLIIAGTPGQGDGPGLLADALAPAPGLSGISPRIEPVAFLRREPLDKFRAIFLVNVPSLPRDAIRALEDYVRGGGGIAWFVGPAVQPTAYNRSLYRVEKSNKAPMQIPPSPPVPVSPSRPSLFPVPLAETRADREPNPASETLDITFAPVGRFTPFAEELGKYWRGSHVSSFIPVAKGWEQNDDIRADGVETIAQLQGGEPIIFRHEYGQGKVITVLTSAGQNWTNWPRQFIYVPFMQELFKALAMRSQAIASQPVGTPITWSLPAAQYDSEVRIIRPDETPDSVRLVPASDAANGPVAAEILELEGSYSKTDEPGIYKALTAPAGGGALEETWYAMNAPAAESQLRLADPAALADAVAGSENIAIREAGQTSWLHVEEAGHEARLGLIVVLVLLLVAEQALAYRLSYHPKAAMARS